MMVSRHTLYIIIITIYYIYLTEQRNCDCGYVDPDTQSYWTEMWHKDFYNHDTQQEDTFIAAYEIGPKYDKSSSRIFKKENVNIVDDLLQLSITVTEDPFLDTGSQVFCAGFGTARNDFLYGSFRSYMKLTPIDGTVTGMFIYHPDGEIDIEVLSSVKPAQAYFAVHPGLLEDGRASHLTHENHELGFDPSEDFHEYRFDWYPGLVVFYVDGIEWYHMTTNILSKPSRFMFNHWTDGNANFSQGPPLENAHLYIKNMTFFFNYTLDNSETMVSPTCQITQTSCTINDAVDDIAIKAKMNEDTQVEPPLEKEASSDSFLFGYSQLLLLLSISFALLFLN